MRLPLIPGETLSSPPVTCSNSYIRAFIPSLTKMSCANGFLRNVSAGFSSSSGVICLSMKRPDRPIDPTHAPLNSSVPVPAAAYSGPVSHAIFRVARLHRMIAGHLLREVGLHPGQEIVMMHLWQAGPQRQADLVRVLDSDAATMTRTIRRLEAAGFVRRLPTPTDKRAWLIEPTAASAVLRQRVEGIWSELEDAAVGGLGAAQRQTIEDTLLTLEARLSRAADRLTR